MTRCAGCSLHYAAKVGDIVVGEADTCVWLDSPRRLIIPRIIRRTLRRGFRRELLWNGNRERPRDWFNPHPEYHIVLWAWTQGFPGRRAGSHRSLLVVESVGQ